MRFLNQAINLIPKNIRRRLFVMLGLAHRAMTLGVRIMVRDDEGRVLLVRHTYVAGWHFPGGAVDRGETAPQAAMKELNEECGIEADGPLKLLQVYKNPITSRFDHVVLYQCDDWHRIEWERPDLEIAEVGFFSVDELPEETTKSTRDRLDEWLQDSLVSDIW